VNIAWVLGGLGSSPANVKRLLKTNKEDYRYYYYKAAKHWKYFSWKCEYSRYVSTCL